MEPTIDPTTGRPLPADAIQRVLHISTKVHVYNIPPLTSNKGHMAASWTADGNKRQIFTARLRIVETATPKPGAPGEEMVRNDILLEDPSNGQLFAAAPYKTPAVVEQVLDSSRFFAIVVQDGSGRKATLGIGFEERSDAFDFSVALQEVRRTAGLDGAAGASNAQRGAAAGRRGPPVKVEAPPQEKKDYSLKEGETITISIGGKGRRQPKSDAPVSTGNFMLPPPGAGGAAFSLPPPPSAQEVKAQRRLSRNSTPEPGSIQEMGFDDGEFGEFQ